MAPKTPSPEPGFVPRKEFIREQKNFGNSFALLAVSGSSCIRLYCFPLNLISSLRRMFEQRKLFTAFREDVKMNLCEFTLEGRPWSSPKSVNSEKLLLDIITTIYQHNYSFLSTIDYGRESDDRVAMAFSIPSPGPEPARSQSPGATNANPGSHSSATSYFHSKRIPFALSFPSVTTMRVISPPLDITPAILQAVRGSWPRGVVSEKKVGDASFEFKLKGYKWFQEDTFATDSLRHIVSLLTALDSYSFSLLTSVSLTGRSRVKDLWIFTGPAPPGEQDSNLPDSPATSTYHSSNADLRRAVQTPEPPTYTPPLPGQASNHRRLASAPPQYQRPPNAPGHTRAMTEGIAQDSSPRPSSSERHWKEHRAVLPSTVSSDIENMTGVGAAGRGTRTPDVFYMASPPDMDIPTSAFSPTGSATRQRTSSRGPLRPVSTRSKTPPLLTSNSNGKFSPPPTPPATGSFSPSTHGSSPPPLLGPGVFRDSAFSSQTDNTQGIPVKWVGAGKEHDIYEHADEESDGYENENEARRDDRRGTHTRPMSAGPALPGAWAQTPDEERTGLNLDSLDPPGSNSGTLPELLVLKPKSEKSIHEVASRVQAPEVREANRSRAKSEMGVVGMITLPTPPPPMPTYVDKGKGKEVVTEGTGQGWVLVNVEGKKTPQAEGTMDFGLPRAPSPDHLSPPSSPLSRSRTKDSVKKRKTSGEHPSSMSPAAKAIVMIDAVEANSKTKSLKKSSTDSSSSGLKKVFGTGKPSASDTDGTPTKTKVKSKDKKPGLRERFRLMGTPEASRASEDRQRNID